MSRKASIDHDDLAAYLEEMGRPVPNIEIARHFDCSKDTAGRHSKLTRTEDGYPVYPTPMGQYYLSRIKDADDLSLMLATQAWSAKCGAAMRRINGEVKTRVESLSPRLLEKLEDEIKEKDEQQEGR